MRAVKFLQLILVLAIPLVGSQSARADNHTDSAALTLEQILVGSHRSDPNIARNPFRHPVETLAFFGLEPDMTLIEIHPSTAWYTEILAPYMRDHGKYYGAHFSPNSTSAYQRNNLADFEKKMTANPELYGRVTIRSILPPHETAIAPAGTADMAMTFRNVHNWIMEGREYQFFEAFYTALKPGGILGVVEHRAKPGVDMEVMRTTGYVSEAYVKELAIAAGFEFVESAEINANAKDPREHPEGVWTLPPNFRMGDVDRAKYDAIGESDRMTLKFIKPAN
jgi:predicted methyltransferase